MLLTLALARKPHMLRAVNSLRELHNRAQQFGNRVSRLLNEELSRLEPRRSVAELMGVALPQLSGNYTRTCIWRAAGLKVGARTRIQGAMHLSGQGNWRELLSFGEDTMITGPLRIDIAAPVRIGSRVRIGHDVTLLTVDHEIGDVELRCGKSVAAGIEIGDGAWLGARCTVLPGISIGEGAVVAAGAVVTHDVPPNTLVAGVPARVLRDLTQPAPASSRLRRLDVGVADAPSRGAKRAS